MSYLFLFIIGFIPSFLIFFGLGYFVYKVLNEDKDRTKKQNKEFINLPDVEKENKIISVAQNHLRTYLNCLSVGNCNKMKYICTQDYFNTLKSEEKHRKSIDGSVQVNRDYNILNCGIIDYKEYDQYEYITVAILIKGYDYQQDKHGQTYGFANFEKYSKYSITFINLVNKSDVEQEGVCSKCGAPLKIENGRCAYCGKFIGDTYSDFLITNINKSY